MSSITQNPTLGPIFKEAPGFWVPFDLSCGTFVVTYPCRDETMLNVALRHPTKPENEDAQEWNNDTDVEDIAVMVQRYNPALPDMFRLAESVSVHKVFRRDPLETYTRGRGVIIGDAAHPIQPTHGKRVSSDLFSALKYHSTRRSPRNRRSGSPRNTLQKYHQSRRRHRPSRVVRQGSQASHPRHPTLVRCPTWTSQYFATTGRRHLR